MKEGIKEDIEKEEVEETPLDKNGRASRFCWTCGKNMRDPPHMRNRPCGKPMSSCTVCYLTSHQPSAHYVKGEAQEQLRTRYGTSFRFLSAIDPIAQNSKRKLTATAPGPGKTAKKTRKEEVVLESDSD